MGQPRLAACLGGDSVTEQDPNATARMPTPGAATPPPADGWPGSTEPVGDAPIATGTSPADRVSAEPVHAEPPPATPTPAPSPTASGWSPPPNPAAARRRNEPDTGRAASVVFGLVMLAIGLWFFAEQTLGLDLPSIRWSQFWPVILIGLGVWIVLGSMRRGPR